MIKSYCSKQRTVEMIQIDAEIPHQKWSEEITEQLTHEEMNNLANLVHGKVNIIPRKEIHKENNFKVPIKT